MLPAQEGVDGWQEQPLNTNTNTAHIQRHTHTLTLVLAAGALKSTKGKEKCDALWGVKCDAELYAPPLAAPLPHTHSKCHPIITVYTCSMSVWVCVGG